VTTSLVVATDTMKNTTYALAADHLTGSIEDFATVLGRHFLEFEQVDRATVNIREHAWRAIDVDGTPAPDCLHPDRGGDAGRAPWRSGVTRRWSRPASRT
jgi:urate oxidase